MCVCIQISQPNTDQKQQHTLNTHELPGVMAQASNPSTREMEAGGLRVRDQPRLNRLHSKTLSQQNKTVKSGLRTVLPPAFPSSLQ
jgi:hypothetical protein